MPQMPKWRKLSAAAKDGRAVDLIYRDHGRAHLIKTGCTFVKAKAPWRSHWAGGEDGARPDGWRRCLTDLEVAQRLGPAAIKALREPEGSGAFNSYVWHKLMDQGMMDDHYYLTDYGRRILAAARGL